MDSFLDLFAKHRNSVAVLLLIGVVSVFSSVLLLFLELKVAGVVNLQLPQTAAGYAVGGMGILVSLLALAVNKHVVGVPILPLEISVVGKTESVTTAANIPPPANNNVETKTGTQSLLNHKDALIMASFKNDVEVFDRAHKEFLVLEEEPREKTHWDAWALHTRFQQYGKLESFKKLLEKVAEEKVNLYYVYWLSECYEFTAEPGKQKQLLLRFYEQAISENYAPLINKYAEVIEKIDGVGAAREIFVTSLRKTTRGKTRALLLTNFAKLLQQLGEKTLAAAAYELAFSLNDSPDITRFSAAYEQSNMGFDYLSFKNYEVHLRKEPDHLMALNNLGVQCETFLMLGKSIEFFKKSVEKGETLAMSNLASTYIAKGFFKEAKDILDKAKLDAKPNENVMTTYTQLQEKIKKEDDVWGEALKRGIEEQEFMRNYATAALLEIATEISLAGQWILTDGTVVTLTQVGTKAEGNWIEGGNAVSFTAEIAGRCFSFNVESKPKSGYTVLGIEKENGVGYLFSDGKLATLFCPGRKNKSIGVYKRC